MRYDPFWAVKNQFDGFPRNFPFYFFKIHFLKKMKNPVNEKIIQNPLKSFMRTLFLNFDFCNVLAKNFWGRRTPFWLEIGHGLRFVHILHI
jgi:hypothetical protein